MKDFWLVCIFGAILMAGFHLAEMNHNLKLIADRIQEANMTYEEYCEYWPEECEELF